MMAVMFHNVIHESLDAYDRGLPRIHENRFSRMIDHFRSRFRILPLPEAVARLRADADTSSDLVITFDDGFAGVYDCALPILERQDLVATVFVLTDAEGAAPVDRLLEFERLELAFRLTKVATLDVSDFGLNVLGLATPAEGVQAMRAVKRALKLLTAAERLPALEQVISRLEVDNDAIGRSAAGSPRHRKLDSDQVRGLLDAGWSIGGHTRNHPVLRGLPPQQLSHEVAGNAADLAATYGLRGAPFAYPYGTAGDFDEAARDAVAEAGFSIAFTTVPGVIAPTTDPFMLPRYSDSALLSLR
jgi:peptidoglycan/xylan/chitin deacetylase (PgdA/CDA1 family)